MTAPAERAAGFETSPTAELVEDAAALAPWSAAWDRLARARRRPFCAPAWMLAWWRHGARPDCRLRTVVVHQGRELLGVAPFFVERAYRGLARYRILAAPWCHGAEPVAVPGREREVGALFARRLAGADPRAPNDDVLFATLVRYCDAQGQRPERDWPPPRKPFRPWFEHWKKRGDPRTVVFGHWARQGLVERDGLRGLDTGCVWGGRLTAWIAEEDRLVSVRARRVWAAHR